MTSPHSLFGLLTDRRAIRHELFSVHVQWHRMRNVIEMSTDGGRLVAELLAEHPDLHATVLDLTDDPRTTAGRLDPFGSRAAVRPGGVLDELEHGADYYLLPDGLDALDAGRLQRLLSSVARACLPRGRALACTAEPDAMRCVMAAERAGLEVTRMASQDGTSLIEFGTGMLRALPNE